MDAEVMANEVAKELRKRGIRALRCTTLGCVVVIYMQNYAITNPDFAGMTALEIADEIQAQEARRAQEWAGDA